jgi:hypothetical protein
LFKHWERSSKQIGIRSVRMLAAAICSSSLLSNWPAVKPEAKQKHLLVNRVIQPEMPKDPIERVEIEAVFSRAVLKMACGSIHNVLTGTGLAPGVPIFKAFSRPPNVSTKRSWSALAC